MSLPSLGIPKYQLTVPSTKKTVTYRPFLVKEQKVLFMALESNDEKQILAAICATIESCVDGISNAYTMPMFDIEYIFTKIRSKSVGEVVDLKARCSNCQMLNDISMNLDDVEVIFPSGISNKIMLTDKIGITIRYPCPLDANQNISGMNVEQVIDFICGSIESVFDENNVYTKKDFSDEDIRKFVESMSSTQFEIVGKFYTNLPSMKKEVECKCINCGTVFSATFTGMQDFFT